MRLVVVGTGYVGLVSGACFADAGHEVVCVDKDADKIATLNAGTLPIYEPGLDAIVARSMRAGTLSFATDLAGSVSTAEAVFIAVGTPPRPGDGRADLSHVFAAAREVAAALPPGATVIVKSTVPVGTGDEVERIIRAKRPRLRFSVGSNPEFLRAGAAVGDFCAPDRVVLGADDPRARDAMSAIYNPLRLKASQYVHTSRRSAELIKYGANAFLAAKIAFINEMADLCARAHADIQEVAKGIGLDPRIGPRFLEAGPGFGGSCFPKDTLALVKMGEDHRTPMRIAEAVLASNERRKRAMASIVTGAIGIPLRGRTIAVLGLTFKPETDDLRESPAITLVQGLLAQGLTVQAYDPAGMKGARRLLSGAVRYCRSAYEAAENADAVVIATEWNEFRTLDLARLRSLMKRPILVDLRNVFLPAHVAAAGLHHHRIGAAAQATQPEIARALNGRPTEARRRLSLVPEPRVSAESAT